MHCCMLVAVTSNGILAGRLAERPVGFFPRGLSVPAALTGPDGTRYSAAMARGALL